MRMTQFEVDAYNARRAEIRKHQKSVVDSISPVKGFEKESKLRESISKWCESQWPKWVIVSPRPDVPSTLPLGCQDLTIFGQFPMCLLVELKSKSGKLSQDQNVWKARMASLGWTVHTIRTLDEFLTETDTRKGVSGTR